MLDRLTALLIVCFLLLFPAACTESQSQDKTVPPATAPAVDHTAHRQEHDNCGVFCEDACHDVSADECSYDTAETCVAACVPSCEEGELKTEVQACQEAANQLYRKN